MVISAKQGVLHDNPRESNLMNTKHYTHKLSTSVAVAMSNFANGECLLVKKDLTTPNNKPLNCHYNVCNQIVSFGGKVVNGWLLDKTPSLIHNGIWHWSFHSVWEAQDGEWYDLTIDKHNGREYSTFYVDKQRSLDLQEGYGYNDILVFESQRSVETFAPLSEDVVSGEVYWTAKGFSLLKHHSEHTGRYLFLRKEFSHNFVRFEKDYGITVIDGRLYASSAELISEDIFFDYSVS